MALWELISSVFQSLLNLLYAVLLFSYETLSWLHFEAPRLEGLLAGILLAWLLSRRESHPIVKLISAPLKLILDIMDLTWDKGLHGIEKLYGYGKSLIKDSFSWTTGKIKQGYRVIIRKLSTTKDNLEDK